MGSSRPQRLELGGRVWPWVSRCCPRTVPQPLPCHLPGVPRANIENNTRPGNRGAFA